MNQKLLLPLLMFILGIASSPLLAQTINTDRPDQTESSSVIPAQSFQIESGLQIDWNNQTENAQQNFLLPTYLLRYGLNPWLELRLNNSVASYQNTYNDQHAFGMNDIELGVKIQLFKSVDSPLELAFLSHVILPIGHQELSNYRYGSINKLSFSHPLGNRFSAGYNVGFNYYGINQGDITYSLAVGFELSEKWGIYVEPFGEMVNCKTLMANADAGITYLVKRNLQLDFSGGTGLNNSMAYLALGLSWNSK